jgi:hypothetical protein
MSFCDSNGAELLVQYSEDASLAWDAAGHTWQSAINAVGMLDVSGGDKSAETFYTFGGPQTGVSQRGTQNIAMNVLFKNAADSFLEFLTDTWDGTEGKCFYLRWAYANGATGALRRTARVALLTNPFTGGDSASGAPVSKSLTFAVDGDIKRDTVPAPSGG